MEASPILTAERLTVGYGNKAVLPPVDISIAAGDFVGLIGANGAGKSTLLRTLSGVQHPLEGSIRVNGKELSTLSPRRLAKEIAIVYTDRVTSSGLTVRQVVALGRHPHISVLGRMSSYDKAIIDNAIDTAGVGDLSDKYLSCLSDGERQKVMIARTLAQETPIIMLDEPTTFLDIASRLELFQLLHTLAQDRGKAIIMSTHEITPLLNNAMRILMITAEKEILDDSPANLISTGNINRLFNSAKGIEYSPTLRDFVLVK